jgi:glycosyltransferase involved in cell wall biosynthesis
MTLVSIITPYYRGAKHIGETLASVQNQTTAGWEYIIVDDGSPDDALATLAPFLAADSRIRLLRQANAGACTARNAGYRACKLDSRYVLFLDQDDILEPDMLRTLCAYLDSHADAGLAFCERALIDEDGELLPTKPLARYVRGPRGVSILPTSQPDTPLVSFLVYNRSNPSTVVMRRDIFEKAGGWDESLPQSGEDTDLWMRCALLAPAHYVPVCLVRRRMHRASVLGTVGRSGQQAREAVMLAKWRCRMDLGPQDRRQVTNAFRFREQVFSPWLFFHWGVEEMQQGRLASAGANYVRGLRLLAKAMLKAAARPR